jgi:hypothetical protein
MNWKTTLILLGLVCGLGAWVYFGESKLEVTKPGGDKYVLHPQVKADEVTKLVIARGAGLPGGAGGAEPPHAGMSEIVLEKEDKVGWKMTKPLADRADDGKAREITVKLEFLEWKERLEDDKAKSAPFGEVEQRLTATTAKGDVTIEIGAKFPGDVRYARVQGKPEVYLIAKDLSDYLAWDLYEFRSKELFTIVGVEAGKLTAKLPPIAAGTGAPTLLELVKGSDRFFRIGGAGGELAETKKVTDIVDKIQKLKPSGIVADAPTPDDLAKFGLDNPEIEIQVDAAEAPPPDPAPPKDAPKPTPKSEKLVLGKAVAPDSDVRYARFGTRAFVYKVDASDALRELRKDPTTLRWDALFPLHAGADGVTGLTAKWTSTGAEVRLKKKDEDWSIEAPSTAKAERENVKAMLRVVADLKIAGREDANAVNKLGDYGLAQPGLTITLDDGGDARTVQVGSPVPSQEGVFYVRRVDEARVFTAKLGDLREKLEAAPLALRSKTLLRVSHWDAISVSLISADGKTDFEAKKDKQKWSIPGVDEKDLDEERVSKVLATFDEVKASELVAAVTTGVTLDKYGLDKPARLTITTEKWDADSSAKKKTDSVLLLGKREGDKVYAMEQGSSAVGRIDAEFLDKIARGFRKGKELFQVSSWDVASVVVKEGANEILNIEKRKEGPDEEWYLGTTKLVRSDVRDKLLEVFEKVEGTRIEPATDASKQARGLAPVPYRTITIKTKKAFGDKSEETKVLLLGQRAGEHDIYAMDGSGTELGVIYDAPVTKVDAFIANPPKAPVTAAPPVPPAPAPTPAKADGAPVTSPAPAGQK